MSGLHCPRPFADDACIQLGHGSGGKLAQQLLREVIFPYFHNPWLVGSPDSAALLLEQRRVLFTTDSFVVKPLFFPGGDIGKLAVYGTVNDLAMGGAKPRYLSCGLILEEGLPLATLRRVLASMREAAQESGVQLVTGDTKVVERGKGDGLYINTAGIGIQQQEHGICPQRIAAGDAILLSGDIGRHGMAVMALREGLEFDNPLRSDCAELATPVLALLQAGVPVHCLRDLTRGGLAAALVELAEAAQHDIRIDENTIPVTPEVQGACELLGLDPLYVANEGRFVAFIPQTCVARAQTVLQRFPTTSASRVIGRVDSAGPARVILSTRLGSERLLALLPGEQLPRIC